MATFPTQDMNGCSYLVQIWSSNIGGLPIIVNIPADQPPTPEVTAVIRDFGQAFAALVNGSVSLIALHQTVRTELTP
ncbi:hypothetical protein ACF09L_32580 [Streptomyces sp. NPDC014779]|uniref:hypothetical protein n=1 Tax=Streptomyces sp. NPDC014779 TaxID=3364911 RepID=UPI003700DA9A